MEQTRVMVAGAAGRMGQAVMKGVLEDEHCLLVGALDVRLQGVDVGVLLGRECLGVEIESDLQRIVEKARPDVMVDFTSAEVAIENIRAALSFGVYPVVGTTGFKEEDLEEIHNICENNNVGAFFAPNFAIGAVLMMQYAANAVKYFPNVEIIELHHDQKIDAPSGTALRTADLIALNRKKTSHPLKGEEKLLGARGGDYEGIRVHSVRLPGLVAHQEVVFGGLGQTLTFRHDSISRESFIPGVLLAVKEAPKRKGVVVGLEKLMSL